VVTVWAALLVVVAAVVAADVVLVVAVLAVVLALVGALEVALLATLVGALVVFAGVLAVAMLVVLTTAAVALVLPAVVAVPHAVSRNTPSRNAPIRQRRRVLLSPITNSLLHCLSGCELCRAALFSR
jgi:hypothetical protein